MSKEFLKTKLVGKRFETHSLPLEFLRDFKAYEELIRNIAKVLYFEEHPDRSRIPRKFFDNFSLHLKSIGPGSTELVLERVFEEKTLFSANDEFEKAQTLALDCIEAVNTGKSLPAGLPIDYLRYFDKFGGSLKEDERMDLLRPKDKATIPYNTESRKKLVLSQSTTYTAHAALRGRIEAVDDKQGSFRVRTISGLSVTIQFEDVSLDRNAIIDGFRDNKTKRYLVAGMGVFDRDNRFKEMKEIDTFCEIDPNDVPARLEEMSLLKDGWLDGEGKAPTPACVNWVAEVLENFPDELPLPLLFPTEEGNIQAEWSEGNSEISALFNFNEKNIIIESLNLETNKPQTKTTTEEKFSKTLQTLLGKKTKE